MGIKFTEKQRLGWRMLTDRSKTRLLFDGGSRSGKTVLVTEYLVMRALQYPESRQLIARKHRAHARQSIWNNTLKTYLARHVPSSACKKSETEMTVSFRNGSSIMVDGLDDADRVEKILGNEFITVFLNEATQLSWPATQMLMTRLAQRAFDADGRAAKPKLIIDCNPRGPRHWLHSVGVRHCDPHSGLALPDSARWGRLSWSAYDNVENLPREYIESLESLPEIMRDRMLNGIWRGNEGAVYNEFDESVHVEAPFPIPADWRRVRAIDFGYTNPFVCLWGALDNDGRLHVYREHYKERTRTAEHADIIKDLSSGESFLWTVADHDAGERAELESRGLRTEKAMKDIREGVQAVKNRLATQNDGRPRLFFFSNLANTLSEIYDYVWRESRDGANSREEPVKENDHAMDALRYMVMAVDKGGGGKPKVSSVNGEDGRWK